jgi:hypothetical protein
MSLQGFILAQITAASTSPASKTLGYGASKCSSVMNTNAWTAERGFAGLAAILILDTWPTAGTQKSLDATVWRI